ncbi:hypothetical protein EZV62_015120 [Acer yangbiense]|uniref:CCHC-type domain-containing protein n=1 Tax=Acer yangbiense TaxID=1000413 RepID=A0A5C7HTV0_9ROSI|nr:hypothetical protein EZV62_015120 [Acer yangbiense]
MSANEIARLCENLSIKDEDREIHKVSGGVDTEGVKSVDHCLVVDIEAVGENVFMFFFDNPEDRIWVWQRGPWHFDKSLLVLEIPEGTGEISKMSFNRADFWVQIHNIPIMCMNRRMAKWLAEQIGEVIEIPSESRDCWGKFFRVKVRIDISRPLKRWLRLSLDQSGNIVVVGLKYERLPEFCFACGKIGHGINDCPDKEAKKEAMEGTNLRFGSWMRAPISEKTKDRSSSQVSGRSSVRDRSMGSSQGSRKKEILAIEMGHRGSQGSGPTGLLMGVGMTTAAYPRKTLGGEVTGDETVLDQMCVEDSRIGPSGSDINEAQEGKRNKSGQMGEAQRVDRTNIESQMVLEKAGSSTTDPIQTIQEQNTKMEIISSPMKTKKKWKRLAREKQSSMVTGLMASPLHRKWTSSITAKKAVRRNSLSPGYTKSSPRTNANKEKIKSESDRMRSPNSFPSSSSVGIEKKIQSCKRRVVFEKSEEAKDTKKLKLVNPTLPSFQSAKPAEQAHREQ